MDINTLATKIAGEITLAENPGAAIRKWREIFNVSQKDLSKKLKVSSSVISDYESGRRKSPGTKLIARIVNALIDIDLERGGRVVAEYSRLLEPSRFFEAIVAIREFTEPKKIKDIARVVNGSFVVGENAAESNVYGYTVIDSIKAIVELSPIDLAKIYGATTQRALVFLGVTRGRSPILAIKLTGLKPAVVVYHGKIEKVDPLAVELARRERIPIIVSNIENVEELVENLRSLE